VAPLLIFADIIMRLECELKVWLIVYESGYCTLCWDIWIYMYQSTCRGCHYLMEDGGKVMSLTHVSWLFRAANSIPTPERFCSFGRLSFQMCFMN